MKTDFFIASRLRLRPESGKMSAGVVIAVAGVALALAVMILSVAVMLGFKNKIREKVMGFEAQLTVTAYSPESGSEEPVSLSPRLRSIIAAALPQSARIAPVIRRPVILKTDSSFSGMIFKGIAPGTPLPLIEEAIVEGAMPDYSADSTLYHIAISRNAAAALGVSAGDRVSAFFIDNSGARQRRMTVAAIFDTHFSDYDRTMVFGNIDALHRLNHSADTLAASVIEITGLGSDDEIDRCHRALSRALNHAYYAGETPDVLSVSNIHSTAALYFNWLALLDTNVAVILVMMVLVSGLTLISSLFIIVLERVNMIGILKAIGASNSLIRRIFILVAERLVVTGLLIGNVIALGFLWLQHAFRLIPLDPEAYYLDYVPVEINWWWIIGINLGVVILSAIILIIPSRIVSTISPAAAIRFE